METPDSSDRSRRERRRTEAELFFDEDPLFSDSDEEAEFMRTNFAISRDGIELSHSNQQPTEESSLAEDILKLCCESCVCCKAMKTHVLLVSSISRPSSCSQGSGLSNRKSLVLPECVVNHHNMGNPNKMNIIPNCVMKDSKATAQQSISNVLQSSNRISLRKNRCNVSEDANSKIQYLGTENEQPEIINNINALLQENYIPGKLPGETNMDTKRSSNRRKTISFKLGLENAESGNSQKRNCDNNEYNKNARRKRPKKKNSVDQRNSAPASACSECEEDGKHENLGAKRSSNCRITRNVNQKLEFNTESEDSQNEKYDNHEKNIIIRRKGSRKKNSADQRNSVPASTSSAYEENKHENTGAKRSSNSGITRSVSQNLEFDTESNDSQKEKCNYVENNINARRKISKKTNSADQRKSAPASYASSVWKDLSSENQKIKRKFCHSIGLEPRHELRRSSRGRKLKKPVYIEYSLPKSRTRVKIPYRMIDKRIFKIPIDTTSARGYKRALARALGRRGGIV